MRASLFLAGRRCAALALLGPLALLIAWPLSVQAAPLTLTLDGRFTVTNNATDAASQGFAALVGLTGWNNSQSTTMSVEVDFQDTLTQEVLNPLQSRFFHDEVEALRIRIGNLTLSSTGLTAASRIEFPLRDPADGPSLLDGDPFGGLVLQQNWFRPTGSSAWQSPGASEAVSANGLFTYAFVNWQGFGGTPPAVQFRALTLADTIAANPTGRFTQSSWRVSTRSTDSASPPPEPGTPSEPTAPAQVPEPSGLALASLAALMAWRRGRRLNC